MDLKTFLTGVYNVHESKHGNQIIYVGHDMANRWSAFFKGKEQDLGMIDTQDQAEAVAHQLFDSGKKCAIKLDWKLMARTKVDDLTQ